MGLLIGLRVGGDAELQTVHDPDGYRVEILEMGA
jgi:hypothetical protein